jgi:hypothetical protein
MLLAQLCAFRRKPTSECAAAVDRKRVTMEELESHIDTAETSVLDPLYVDLADERFLVLANCLNLARLVQDFNSVLPAWRKSGAVEFRDRLNKHISHIKAAMIGYEVGLRGAMDRWEKFRPDLLLLLQNTVAAQELSDGAADNRHPLAGLAQHRPASGQAFVNFVDEHEGIFVDFHYLIMLAQAPTVIPFQMTQAAQHAWRASTSSMRPLTMAGSLREHRVADRASQASPRHVSDRTLGGSGPRRMTREHDSDHGISWL